MVKPLPDIDGLSPLVLKPLTLGLLEENARLVALAVIYDGGRRSESARVRAVGLQTVRDWVLGRPSPGR